MTFTKKDMADSISRRLNLPQTKSDDLVDSPFKIMKKTRASGEDLSISRFGKFSAKDKKARRGRNFQTSQDLSLKARRVVIFQCSPVLKAKLNGKE